MDAMMTTILVAAIVVSFGGGGFLMRKWQNRGSESTGDKPQRFD